MVLLLPVHPVAAETKPNLLVRQAHGLLRRRRREPAPRLLLPSALAREHARQAPLTQATRRAAPRLLCLRMALLSGGVPSFHFPASGGGQSEVREGRH